MSLLLMTFRRYTLLTLMLMVSRSAAVAAQDQLEGTRGRIIERGNNITVTVDRGHATLVVRRTVLNRGDRHDQAVYWLSVPASFVATGLRTLGVRDGRPIWFSGDLMEAEAAARRYEKLTGIGGYYPKDPALLSWRSQTELALQVFPVPPFQEKTVEYTLVVPTTYRDGREHLVLPRLGTGGVAPAIVVRGATPGDRLFVDGRPYPSGAEVSWAALTTGDLSVVAPLGRMEHTQKRDLIRSNDDDDTEGDGGNGDGVGDSDGDGDGSSDPSAPEGAREVDLALGCRDQPLVGGRLAEAVLAPGRVLARYRVETAARLGRLPHGAEIVVLLDASRSLSNDQRAAELAAARAYLGHFADAHIQVVTFARRVSIIHPRPVSATRAIEDLTNLIIAPENGSQIDAALREADKLLARQRPAARRVVVLTDLLTRRALTPASARDALVKSGAILHVGVIDRGEPALEVIDDSPWALVARSTGGLVWTAMARDEPRWNKRLHAVYEEWARPVRLRSLGIDGAGMANLDAGGVSRGGATSDGQPLDAALPGELREGQSASLLWIHRQRLPEILVTGELWASPVRVVIKRDLGETRLWAALAFGTDILNQLSEPEMMILARAGRAVSPVTSYLAIEPGVRPSTEGLTELESSGWGAAAVGIAYGNLGTGGGGASTFDALAFLHDQLAATWKRCAGEASHATVTIETTRAEVVDVPEVATRPASQTAGRCLIDAAWSLDLPKEFAADHGTWAVSL